MNPAGPPFDYNVIQAQQRMQNGNNGSPAFQSPMYQTQPMVPAKRPRQREDSVGASPRQGPGMLPPSRSQTPQQGPYSGFQGAVNGTQPFQAPNPYHRFSNATSNASLSPSMQTQQFNPQAPPARVQSVSPSPFSPGVQNFGSQASPPPQSEHASRVATPQNGATSFMQGMSYAGGPNQPYTSPLQPNGSSVQPPQNLQQQQRMHEMRQRQIYQQHVQQANHAAMQIRYPGMGPNPSMNPSGHMPSMVAAGGRMQNQQQPVQRPNALEQFVRSVAQWMQQRGLAFNPHPTVTGRPVNLMQLFQLVMKFGGPAGSKSVTARGQWPTIAQHLQVAPAQLVVAAGELQQYWQSNLLPYEAYLQNAQRQRAMQDQSRMQRLHQNGDSPSAPDPYSPLKARSAHLQDTGPTQAISNQSSAQNGYATPSKRIDHQQPDARAVQLNGYLTPHHGTIDARHSSLQNRQTSQVAHQSYISPPPPSDRLQIQATKVAKKTKVKDQGENGYPRRVPLDEEYIPTYHDFSGEPSLERYGGLHVDAAKVLGDDVAATRPTMPLLHELGVIDVQALTLSLKSGIKGEVRLALDTLCALSLQIELDLGKCGDLVDALVECAEEQVDFLAENAAEVSDDMLINSYEEILRACKMESLALQMPPEYGSLEYDLDRAVDRLICIITTLRNFSSYEKNWELLGTSAVIPLMANVMRYLGTRNMLLRTHKNTVDFAKDAVVCLSNVSLYVKLPGKEDALCLLHFLLSFAPSPPPTNTSDGKVMFSSYDPSQHSHLPPAIDSFAKLLARDEPNRGFFRSIFSTDNTSSPPLELLTKAFGFAVAALPKHYTDLHGSKQVEPITQARGPYLAQALLAAETLVGLIPASEHSLARAWLASQDGFAANLIQLILYYSSCPSPQPHQNQRHPAHPSLHGEIYATVIYRGLAVLRKLAERAKDAETDGAGIPLGILPDKESLLSQLKKPHVETGVLRQLYTYATLDL
ncbi:MAG: hypothetical protein L6R40_002755 [Gallowayella cf. fulva]|nr:MAG: hypothetical protein L6R40_002755 [Xanthomendoza cf. fulva]